jgi:serine/threonine protein kinase
MFPERFGRYEIRRELGHGGMARVYLAWDPVFEREVAIKVLPRDLSNDTQFRTRFEREAKIVAGLEHPAIVPVYDFGESEGLLYLVMRYMPAGSLKDRLDKEKFSLPDAAMLIGRIAPALDLAHSRGIIHRDIKPGNILFDSSGEAYLSDFGIAKIGVSGTTLTGNFILGTPAYMSPEQARGEPNIDGRSDVYSLGAMLFEMLSGRVPYEAETPSGQLMRHINDPVPDILAVCTNLPATCQEIIGRSMAKAPAERYQTARELSAHLKKIASSIPDSAIRTTAVKDAEKARAGKSAQTMELPKAPALFLLALIPIGVVLFGGLLMVFKFIPTLLAPSPSKTVMRLVDTVTLATPSQPAGIAEVFFRNSGPVYYSLMDGGETKAVLGNSFLVNPGTRLWTGDRAAWITLKDSQARISGRFGLGPGASIILSSIGGNGSALSLKLQQGMLLADSPYLIVETQTGGYNAHGKTVMLGVKFDPAADEFTVDCMRGSCLAGASDQASVSLSEGKRQIYRWGNRLDLAPVLLEDWITLGSALAMPTATIPPTTNAPLTKPVATLAPSTPTPTSAVSITPTKVRPTSTRPPVALPTATRMRLPTQTKKKTPTPAAP